MYFMIKYFYLINDILYREDVKMAERPKGETAKYSGTLELGNFTIDCGVMEDGTRLLSERGVAAALRTKRGGSHWLRKKAGSLLPVYASANNLSEFISPELTVKLIKPRYWRAKGQGGYGARGLEASALPAICDVYLKARREGKLLPSQMHVAQNAEILISALAKVGVVALVDEATGYQEVRKRNELQELLKKYISDDLLPWTKRFPDEFYSQIFRLKGYDFKMLGLKGRKPRSIGAITSDIVYERMPEGVLGELREKNPPNVKGNRNHKHHQFLTEDIGDRHLERLIADDITLMSASNSWAEFMRLLNRVHPKGGIAQGELNIEGD